jgi:serine phosphatase RsbU (regulator of sigma subunit)
MTFNSQQMKQLQIFSPDGKTRFVPLENGRISLGRATTAELSFPEDGGLSRQHLAIEREGDGWALLDLGSKNGTMVNGVKVTERMALKSGDRIAAGHLVIVYDGANKPQPPRPVVIFDTLAETDDDASARTVVTHIDRVFRKDGAVADPQLLATSHISALIRAGNELAGNRPLPELFRFILDLAIQAVQADRGILMTAEGDDLIVRANKGEGFRISTAVRDRVLTTGESVLVRDTAADDAFRERRSIVEQNIRTLMAVPLHTREKIIGLIYLDSPSLQREFTKDDLNLLTVMANVAAIRIENTRLAELEEARRLMARDLEQAAEIQKGFLPTIAPEVRGLDVAGFNAPCRTVGGDYYDFFAYGESRIAMVLGDVSGKGMPASLLMMGLQARVQVLIEEPKSLADVMTRLNRITSANLPSNRFITLFLCILDGDTGELTFCNAGHNPPLIISADGKYRTLKGGGPVLGILPSIEYRECRETLAQGETLVIYSDGVTEAVDPADDEFDIEGLARAAGAKSGAAQAIIENISNAVVDYTAGAAQSDDITLVVARRVAR